MLPAIADVGQNRGQQRNQDLMLAGDGMALTSAPGVRALDDVPARLWAL